MGETNFCSDSQFVPSDEVKGSNRGFGVLQELWLSSETQPHFTDTSTDSGHSVRRNSLPHTRFEVVAGGGIEPPTQGFSVLCSTN